MSFGILLLGEEIMKKRHLSDITSDFLKSEEYFRLSSQSKENAQALVKSIGDTAEYTGHGDYTKWDADFIAPFTLGLIRNLSDETQYSLEWFNLTYEVLKSVLKFLARTKRIKISAVMMDNLLQLIESQTLFEKTDSFILEPEYQDPYLPQWTPHVADNISTYVSQWLKLYEESSAWEKRPKGVDKGMIEILMKLMTESAYNVYRKTPKTWTKFVICEVMRNQFVEKLDLSVDEYKLIVPAMSSMLNYLGKRALLNSKKVENYKRYLAAGEADMLEAAKDPGNYGASKLIYQEMQRCGLDISNRAEVEKFIQEVNDNGGIDSLLPKEIVDKHNFTEEEMRFVLNHPEHLDSIIDRFSVGLEEIADEHISVHNNHRWSRKQFERIERNGIKDGIKVWLDKDKYKLPKYLKAIDAMAYVVSLETRIYARTLEIPKNWSIETWQMIAGSFDSGMVKEKTIVKALVQFKADERVIDQMLANQILNLFAKI